MKNLSDYVKVYPDWIDTKNRKRMVKELNKTKWEKHAFNVYSSTEKLHISGDDELSVSTCDNADNNYVMQRIWDGFRQYIQDVQQPTFTQWYGFTQVRYNRYQPGQTMAMHVDHIHSIFEGERRGIPVLTALGVLNDNYEGGEFILCDEEIELNAGSHIVFPSVFLYPHMVKPVKSGIRYSYVAWAW
jgi:hypothetical protein